MSFLVSSRPRSERSPLSLAALSRTYGVLGRWRITRVIVYLMLRRAGRAWLRRTVVSHEVSRTNSVTVVIGARNRADYRLAHIC